MLRSAVLYVTLVGVPLLGLLAVLPAGERLTPPRSMGGVWAIDEPSVGIIAHPCFRLEFDVEQPAVRIAQSGPHVTLTFNSSAPSIPLRLRRRLIQSF